MTNHIRINMAFGDSHGATLPIARDCLIAVGPAAKDDQLLAGQVDLFNELQVRNADARVYLRPGSGLESLAQRVAGLRSAA